MTNSYKLLILFLFFGGSQALAKPQYQSTRLKGIYEYSNQDDTYIENESSCSVDLQITNRAGRVTGILLFSEIFPSIVLDYEQLSQSTKPKLVESTNIIKENLSNEEFMRRFDNSKTKSYFTGQYIVTSRNTTKNGQSYQHILIQSSESENSENINTREVILSGSKIIGYRDYFIKQNQSGDATPKLIGQCFPWTGERIRKNNVEKNMHYHYFVPTGINRNILKAPFVYYGEISLNQATHSESQPLNNFRSAQ